MKTRTWAALVALYLAWGSTYLAIRYAVQSIPPFFLSGLRCLVAGLILYTWRRLAGDPAPSARQWRSGLIIGNVLLLSGIGAVSWAEQYVPSGITSLVVSIAPLWIIMIEALRPGGTRPSRITTLAIVSGLIGIFILINPWKTMGASNQYALFGVMVLILATIAWAAGSIYSSAADLPKSPLLGTGMELLAGSAGSFIIGLASGEANRLNTHSITLQSLGSLGYLIVVGSLIGFGCYTWLLKVAPTTLVSTYAYVNPLIAVILGSLLAREVITLQAIIAAVFIIPAVVMIVMNKEENLGSKTGPSMVKEEFS
jgi:drug/metabolite transporter (DMT)-like permease